MASYVTVRIDMRGVERKFSEANFRSGRLSMIEQAKGDMNQFVPMLNGDLRNQSYIYGLQRGIMWNVPYAKYQFYNQFSNYTTPGTGPRWDLKAKGLFMNDWLTAFARGAGL